MSKFKIGDIVVGNHRANHNYGVTVKDTKWIVCLAFGAIIYLSDSRSKAFNEYIRSTEYLQQVEQFFDTRSPRDIHIFRFQQWKLVEEMDIQLMQKPDYYQVSDRDFDLCESLEASIGGNPMTNEQLYHRLQSIREY